jgi:hypothetical protein
MRRQTANDYIRAAAVATDLSAHADVRLEFRLELLHYRFDTETRVTLAHEIKRMKVREARMFITYYVIQHGQQKPTKRLRYVRNEAKQAETLVGRLLKIPAEAITAALDTLDEEERIATTASGGAWAVEVPHFIGLGSGFWRARSRSETSQVIRVLNPLSYNGYDYRRGRLSFSFFLGDSKQYIGGRRVQLQRKTAAGPWVLVRTARLVRTRGYGYTFRRNVRRTDTRGAAATVRPGQDCGSVLPRLGWPGNPLVVHGVVTVGTARARVMRAQCDRRTVAGRHRSRR